MENVNDDLSGVNLPPRKWLAFVFCVIGYLLCGTVSTIMSTYLPVVLPELLAESTAHKKFDHALLGKTGAYIGAFFLYGWMTGGLIFGFVSDKVGRVPSLALATALTGLSTLMIVFVPDYESLLVLRFLSGTGVGAVVLISAVYISEIWGDEFRPVMLGILAVSFPVGIIASGGIVIFFDEWREAFQLGAVPFILSVLIYWLAPESSHWEQSQLVEKEKRISLFDPIYRENLVIGSLIFSATLIGLWGVFSWLPTWVHTLVPSDKDGQGQAGLSMAILGTGGAIGGIVSGFLIRKFGTLTTLVGTFTGCILMCGLLFTTNSVLDMIVYIEIGLLALCFGVAQGGLLGYIPQLFPVPIRAAAAGFCFNIGRFFTATAVFFIGSFVTFFEGFANALMVFSFPFVIALIVSWYARRQEQLKDSQR